MLPKNYVENICKSCRYLICENITKEFQCAKLTPEGKKIDHMVSDYLKIKKPEEYNLPLDDNCNGYPFVNYEN